VYFFFNYPSGELLVYYRIIFKIIYYGKLLINNQSTTFNFALNDNFSASDSRRRHVFGVGVGGLGWGLIEHQGPHSEINLTISYMIRF
jgi:hypothetical protein